MENQIKKYFYIFLFVSMKYVCKRHVTVCPASIACLTAKPLWLMMPLTSVVLLHPEAFYTDASVFFIL